MLRSLQLFGNASQDEDQEYASSSESTSSKLLNFAIPEIAPGKSPTHRSVVLAAVASKLDLASAKLAFEAAEKEFIDSGMTASDFSGARSASSSSEASASSLTDFEPAFSASQTENFSFSAASANGYAFSGAYESVASEAIASAGSASSGNAVYSTHEGVAYGAAAAGALSAASPSVENFTYRIDNAATRSIDAEKTGVKDTNLCWAATASDMLYWAGWGKGLSINFSIEDNLLDYYAANFTDLGGYIDKGLSWFFSGVYKSTGSETRLTTSSGGGFCKDYSAAKYILSDSNPKTAVTSLIKYLDKGYVCGLGIYAGNNGHAVTCWGYSYIINAKTGRKNITGLWISDSDNNFGEGRSAPDIVAYCPITWNSKNKCFTISVQYSSGVQTSSISMITALVNYDEDFTSLVTNKNVSGEMVRCGTQVVGSYGTTGNNTVSINGIQNISSGGLATKSIVTSGGLQGVYAGGSAVLSELRSSGSQSIFESGSASMTAVLSGGTQSVLYGGYAVQTNVTGTQLISGGTASDTVVSSGGRQIVGSASSGSTASNGIAISTTVVPGGTQTVLAGGIASSTEISGISNKIASLQTISSGGVASGTTVSSEGVQQVCSGGVASGTVANFGGTQIVSSGGSATNITVSHGGSSLICSSAVVSGTLSLSGQADVKVANAASIEKVSAISFSLANAVNKGNCLLYVSAGKFSSNATWSVNLNSAKLGTYTLAGGTGDLSSMLGKTVSVTLGATTIDVVVGSTTPKANVSITYKAATATTDNTLVLNYSKMTLAATSSLFLSLAGSNRSDVDLGGNSFGASTSLTLLQKSSKVSAFASEQVSSSDKTDIYSFTATAIGSFSIALESDAANSATTATLYKIVNGSAKSLGTASLKNNQASISKILDAGEYYVAVSSVNKTVANYTLTVNGDYFPAASDDNTKAKAQSLASGATASDWIGYSDAIDFFKTSGANAVKLDFKASDANAKLLVFSSADGGTTLKQVASYTATKGVELETTLKALASGDYYIEVLSLDKGATAKYNTAYTLSTSAA